MKKQLIIAFSLTAGISLSAAFGVALHSATAEATPVDYYVRGASVRLADDVHDSGVKFHVVMEKEKYDGLSENGKLQTGTLIIPQYLLGESALNVDTPEAMNIDTTGAWAEITLDGTLYMESVAYVYDIPARNYGSDLVAAGYYKETEGTGYIYTQEVSGISMSWVAKAEYGDVNSKLTEEEKASLKETYLDFSVSYHVDDTVNTQTAEYGEKLSVPDKPEKEGYAFIGWFDKKGTTEWNFDSDTVKGNINLYAKFVEIVSVEMTFTPVDMASAETDLVLPFTASSVNSLSIGGIAVNDYTFADNAITIRNYKSALGITNIGSQAGEKEVTIRSDSVIGNGTLLFATAVITQEDLTSGNEAESFSKIIFGQSGYSGYFLLGADIDLKNGNVVSPNTTNDNNRFAGIFDGCGYTISNYKVSATYKALFGNLAASGVIKNLKLTGVELTSGSWLGALACRNRGTISDVYAVYSVSTTGITNNNPAGMVARNDGTMRNCIAEVTTEEGYAYKGAVGAIAGYSSSTTMTNCYAIVNDAGVGILNGRVATGTITADQVPTCKAYVGISAFFAAYESGEADTGAYSAYWHFDREKETISFGA
ncbi:MAG: InlB B-repeat-containing protein [Candidatus Scatosoma sp.]